MNKIDLFCNICQINPRVKCHYKAKFNKIERGIEIDDKRKSAYYIYQILDELDNQIQENNDLRKEKEELINNKSIERRKRHQEEIDSLNKKINEFKNYTEYNWRKITNTFRRYILENEGDSVYEELVDTELQEINKSYYGI